MMTEPLRRRAWIFAGAGAAVWTILWLFPLPSDALPIPRLLMLAMLVVVPIGLMLAAAPDRDGNLHRLYHVLHWAQMPAALIAAASFYVPQGTTAALLAAPWMLFCAGVAVYGLVRIIPRGFGGLAETCIDAALLYLPVGGGWLILSRLGIPVMDFSDTIIALTAIHFHYAGFAAPIFAGMVGRQTVKTKALALPQFRIASVGVISGIALVAVGITLSPLVEMVAALVLAVCLSGVALQCLPLIHTFEKPLPRILIPIASAALFLAMAFAGVYAVGEFSGNQMLVIPQMVQYHGIGNAVGLIVGLIGWAILNPPPVDTAPGTPFSRISGHGRIGPEFFQRIGAVVSGGASPKGLVDDLAEYDGLDFIAGRVHPAIRAFYEDTGRHSLLVRPAWQPGFRIAARLYKRLSAWLGQMNFPARPDTNEDRISSLILPLNGSMDGRAKPRAWVRTYDANKQAVYVAAYATERYQGRTTMNIAFPVPFANVTSILRLSLLELEGDYAGIELTTYHPSEKRGDEGIYLANRVLPVRLPMNETIRVWTPDMPAALGIHPWDGQPPTVMARHEMWLFGIRFLILDYDINPV